jgi:nucleotide-binding universal stress UspA family protein
MFRKILFPTRFEEFSLQVLQSIVCLKAAGLEEVVLLHVINTEALYQEAEHGIPINQDWLRTIATKRFAPFSEYLKSAGIRASTEITLGPVVAKIISTAIEKAVSLIVAGRQKRNVAGDLYTGPVTNGVIRKANVPVLVTKHQTMQEMNGQVGDRSNTQLFKKILYPTDWSTYSKRAKEFLPDLHKLGASEVVIVHVMEDFREAAEKEVESRARENIENLARELQSCGFSVKSHIVQGKSYCEIMRIASEENASLIVIGSQGKGFVKGILWGSVSQRVVEYSEKPVLVVK